MSRASVTGGYSSGITLVGDHRRLRSRRLSPSKDAALLRADAALRAYLAACSCHHSKLGIGLSSPQTRRGRGAPAPLESSTTLSAQPSRSSVLLHAQIVAVRHNSA